MENNKQGLKIVREFKAPKELVFNAFATAEAFAEWWGPAGMPVTVKEFNFTPGGKTLYNMQGHGQVMWGMFVYKTIQPYDLIEFVTSFSDEQGNICTSPFPMDFPLEIFNQLILTGNDGITTITLQGYPINATEAQLATYNSIKENMNEGFKGTFDQLEAYLEKIQA